MVNPTPSRKPSWDPLVDIYQQCTVSLWLRDADGEAHRHGSGVLFMPVTSDPSIGMILTAAHVVDVAPYAPEFLLHPVAGIGFVPLPGTAVFSKRPRPLDRSRDGDLLDAAVIRLPDELTDKLRAHKRFITPMQLDCGGRLLRVERLAPNAPPSDIVYAAVGYPYNVENEYKFEGFTLVKSPALALINKLHSTPSIDGAYDERDHIVLDLQRLEDPLGQGRQIPFLGCMSGGGIWRIHPLDMLGLPNPDIQLSGILHTRNPGAKRLIRGTRMSVFTRLICDAWPEIGEQMPLPAKPWLQTPPWSF